MALRTWPYEKVDPFGGKRDRRTKGVKQMDPTPSNTTNSTLVLELIRPFDPMSTEAESHYDDVVRRVNRVRTRRVIIESERQQLEDQFVEGDLTVRSGPRRGLPLSNANRRKRLHRLIELSTEERRLAEEERFANESLDRMNRALDRWVRETYGA